MATQEVWITLRIKSELPIEADAHEFARRLCNSVYWHGRVELANDEQEFLNASHAVELVELEEEAEIYESEEVNP